MDSAERSLWDRWHRSHDLAARNELIVLYSPWARLVARDVYIRLYGLRDAWHDCIQNALIGLLEAMDRFDPDVGVMFQTYARHRVRGAVFNGIRTLRENLAQGTRSYDQMAAALERIRSLEDEALTDPLEAFATTVAGLGLGFLLESNSMHAASDVGDVYAHLEQHELRTAIIDAINQLPPREQTILTLHYYHHTSFVDIASLLGVTKGRISQLHRQALVRLRVSLRASTAVDY